jgi:hypothetical protein
MTELSHLSSLYRNISENACTNFTLPASRSPPTKRTMLTISTMFDRLKEDDEATRQNITNPTKARIPPIM